MYKDKLQKLNQHMWSVSSTWLQNIAQEKKKITGLYKKVSASRLQIQKFC